MAGCHSGQSTLVNSLATLLRDHGASVLDGSSTLTLQADSLQHLGRLFEQYLLSRTHQHGFLALPSHPADTTSLLQLQFLFDVLQKTVSLKLINPPGSRLQSVVKIFPFKSLKSLELKRIPPHCLEDLRGVYSQLEVFTCSKSLSSLEELLSLCGGDLSSALPWLELHTLNFSYNTIVCLDESLSLLNVLKSLDLSHNKIQECADFLKPLSELEHLNLGYNNLQRAPTLGLSSRAKLLTLVLRNNELETINGVEQLLSLQHLDLAYNLLLDHSQLAPLSMLHSLNMLNLKGNPLFFQKTHRTCTVRHLSPKAAYLRLRLDSSPLSSSELSVLPKPGQLIGQLQSQASPLITRAPERGNQEVVSSGGGELSDSLSVSEVGVTRQRKKKAKSKVRVRRASISEPSDYDYETRPQSSIQDIVLPHQKEIERMDSFRDQLGEDWLRYQHHLEGAPISTLDKADRPAPPHLNNSLCATPSPTNNSPVQASPATFKPPSLELEVPEVLPPPLLSSESKEEASDWDADLETESTLQWPDHSLGHTESTLETTMAEGLGQGLEGPPATPTDTREEEEEDLGVDLCHPLLVGVLSSSEEEEEGLRRKNRAQCPVFLRVKPRHVLEVDMSRGQLQAQLELDSLERFTMSQVTWTEREVERTLPAVELHFRYISRERRRRRYVMLDDDPQEALQALTEVLSRVMKENERRVMEGRPSCVRLQCLRCGSEFTQRGGKEQQDGGRLRGWTGLEEQQLEEERKNKCREDGLGSTVICPECGSDHVVQLADQSAPSTSTPVHTPVHGSPCQDGTDRHVTFNHRDTPLPSHPGNKDPTMEGPSSARASPYGSPAMKASTQDTIQTRTSMEDPTSFSAKGSSFSLGETWEDQSCDRSLSQPASVYSTEGQSKGSIAGGYSYTVSATPPGPQYQHAEQASPGQLDLLSEDYEAVDHRLKLFLDMEVFEEEEELHSFLKVSTVKFGDPVEFPSFLVVSDQRIYFLEVTSDMEGQPCDWLQKRDSRGITELSYLEVGLGSQSIHMEFEDGPVAYTLLVRDSVRCKRFFSLFTGVVRELATKSDSKLKSISTTRLNPQHHLWPLVCEDMQTDVEDGQLQFFYLLSFLHQEDSVTPLTVLATRETLYLLNEDHQWSKSLPHPSANENGEPCSGRVTVQETQPISCVSSVHLWSSDPCRMDIKLYDEIVKEEKTWSLHSDSAELVQGLLVWVRTQWENMFGVKLAITNFTLPA
ncbi:serine/threonine-protein kinase 11-interacting protein isoform 1-T1 [Salvelinus alpinus]|uniref:serine/threonine-protein kinase 11-interacting protein isoform X1 n=1 Tax=Salvelinus alpinus TaxID=8036 RepID=UPI0039FBD5A5